MTKRHRKPLPAPEQEEPEPYVQGFPLVQIGHPALRQVSHPLPVEACRDGRVGRMVRAMTPIMVVSEGVGLAAPQLANLARLVIVSETNGNMGALINPEITEESAEQETAPEGCLSIPGVGFNVSRPKQISVTALNQSGETVTFDASGFEARVVCHEVDHLNGTLCCDRVTDSYERRSWRHMLRHHFTGTPNDAQMREWLASLSGRLPASAPAA